MSEILKTTLLGLFFGTFGTTIGGILGIVIKRNSNKFLSFILSFASGLMMSIICFDLIPEALGISSIYSVIFGILIGIASMIFCDIVVQRKFAKKEREYSSKNDLLRTGIIVSIGLAIHNFPEGLAIGSGFEASLRLGLSLAIAICLHDIPERNFYVCSYEKWGNEKVKSYFLCFAIRYNNWGWCIFWCYCRFYFRGCNCYLFEFCSWSNVVYCVWRVNS